MSAEIARIVAEHWRDAAMRSDDSAIRVMAHPLALVLCALDGETEPIQLGISDDDPDAERIRFAALATTQETRDG